MFRDLIPRQGERSHLVAPDLPGFGRTTLVSPDGYAFDHALMSRPGNAEIQLEQFRDYGANVVLFPWFQEYFRTCRPPLLAVRGRNDPIFLPAGAEAFRRDSPGMGGPSARHRAFRA
jgi:hypothetical protein